MKIHPQFRLNGKAYTESGLHAFAVSCQKLVKEEEKQLSEFLKNWLNENPTIDLQTSGSTGLPKTITVSKLAMCASAESTGAFFNLHPGNTALLCLPMQYIAGKMMVVRAMVLGLALDTIVPKTILNLNGKHYDFTALVPMQAELNFDSLHQFKTVLIGGAPITETLRKKITKTNLNCIETYGMTETLTHVATRKITNPPTPFCVMPDVTFSVDHDNCLVLSVPYISNKTISTNDVVERVEKDSFYILGRRDFVINSGGKKIFPEQLEKKLQMHFPKPFFFTSIPDAQYGEKLILIVEGNTQDKAIALEVATTILDKDKHHVPKLVYCVDAFIHTASGKLDRKGTTAIALK